MLFAVDSYEELIQIPGIAETTLSPFQASSIVRSELPTPSPDGFVGNNDAAFREKIFHISEAKVARDPSGWQRRILSPVLPGVEFEFMRTTIGPDVNAGVFLPHAHGSREYVAVESGSLLLTLDGTKYKLRAGDSVYYDGDCLHAFANPNKVPCVYYLAMDGSGDSNGTEHRIVGKDSR